MNHDQRSSAPGNEPEHWALRLYVAGQTDKSIRAITNPSRDQENYRGPFKQGTRACGAGCLPAMRVI